MLWKNLAGILALSLVTTSSFASIKPTDVRCPSRETIMQTADQVKFDLKEIGDHQYVLQTREIAFTHADHQWKYAAIMHATDKKGLKQRARDEIKKISSKYNTFAEQKGEFLTCVYFGFSSIIVAGTPAV